MQPSSKGQHKNNQTQACLSYNLYYKNSNQKVNFSEIVIIEEVQISLEEVEEEAVSWDDLDSSDEEEETDETSE